MSDSLLCSVEDGVAVLTFNRPEAANTWSVDLHVSYLDALRELAADDRVRAVVVTGAGRHFCAGADVSLLDAIQNGEDLPPELGSESFLEPIDFPKPLIAAINGPAAGIGLVHALLCDIRIASERALLTTSFVQRGLVAEHGISWLLPQLVGRGHALDLLLSSRRVGADEAGRIGLVHRVVPADDLLDEAVRYAHHLAENCSPAAMAVIKRQVTRHATLQLLEAERETLPLVEESLKGADFGEGVRSFIERRSARFAPLGQGSAFEPPGEPCPDPARVAEEFFAATSANDWDKAVGMLSADARVSTHPGPPAVGVEDLVDGWRKLCAEVGPWEYRDVRRLATDSSFCEQHRVCFTDLDLELEVCVVATLDRQGRIRRLEEYADGRALRAAVRRRAEELEGVR
jgi:enoyl-CoA hydratase/carnithine racemase